MGEHQYVFSQIADVSERERLGLREQLLDAGSQRYLTALGIQKGWRCLEVGAGQGSIARWLAEQVGPQGRVVATDINTRFLTEMQWPNVEVRQHDIRTAPLEPGTYHLAHCRAVLIHMPEPQLVVRRMVEALQMGGWLLIEEPDLSSVRAADAIHPLAESFDRQYRETCDRMAWAKLADPYLGRRVRGLLEDAGLTEIGSVGVSRIARGGGTEARRNCMSLQAFMERGILSHTEYADLQSAFLAPNFSFITETTFAAWGKRTSSPSCCTASPPGGGSC